mmetsp:Transcript_37346/g.57242  ORF Transcript_37346/g.57242 Transcript_37346/m.57242 type:complete len:98 (+) Transcript_37346:604-897(+)
MLPKFEGDLDDRNLTDMIPFLDHLSQHKGDVRQEIKKYGRENCGKKYAEQKMQQMQFIQNQRSRGLSGVMSRMQSSPGTAGQSPDELNSGMSFGKNV